MKKSLVIILALVLVFAFSATAMAAAGDSSVTWTISTNGGSTYSPITSAGVAIDKDDSVVFKAKIDAIEPGEDVLITQGVRASIGTIGAEYNDIVGAPSVIATTEYTYPATGLKVVNLSVKYTVAGGVEVPADKTINVYVGDGDARLASLTLSAGPGSLGESTFSAADFGNNAGDYSTVNLTGHVDLAADNVLITATPKSGSVTVDGTANSKTLSFSGTSDLPLNVIVTAENGRTKTYALTVKQDFDNTGLKLTIGSKTLTPDSSDIFEYMFPYGSIENGDSLAFKTELAGTLTASKSKGAIDVSYSKSKKEIKVTFEEDPGSSIYKAKIIVTALDGDTETEYILELSEADPVLLDDLNIMIGSTSSSKDLDYTMLPSSFDDETFTYYVFVPWDSSTAYKDDVDVFFNAEFDTDFDVDCDGTPLTDGDFENVGNVAAGDSETFTITVDDNGNIQEYEVNVYYGSKNAADDASLKDLYVKYGSSYKTDASLSPAFSKSTYTYTASLPLNTKSAKITLKLSDSDAIIICNGEQVGSTFTASNLKNGANTFKFVVMAEDYDTTKTYTVTLNVGSGGLLSGLVFTPMSGSLNVSPAFSGDVYNYVANVANSVSAIYVTPTAVDSSYTISVYKGASDYKTVVSGKTSSAITLSEGLNEVKVYVYKSGSSKTYTLNIYRQPAKTKYQVSSQKITVNGTSKSLYAVNINGNNFLKLRDLAYILSGTTKQFNVNYTLSTNTAAITSLTAYVNDSSNPVNQPIVLSNPQLSSQIVTVDGKSAYPVAYNVAGSNYVNLRQVCAMLDIGLTFSSANNSIAITTANSYTPGL